MGDKAKNLVGQKFGRLTVVERSGTYVSPKGCRKARWKCLCDCGNITFVNTNTLTNGHSNSCGCLKKELSANRGKNSAKHNMSYTRLYSIWSGIKSRCEYENGHDYKNYGKRGIKVCEPWKNSFESFRDWAFETGYKDDMSIDRIDVDDDYCPENCRWIELKLQQRNKTTNRYITAFGETKTLIEWAEQYDMVPETISYRLDHGYTEELAITEPVKKYDRLLTYNNETKTVSAWSREFGIYRKTITSRIDTLGWSVEKALTTPVRGNANNVQS